MYLIYGRSNWKPITLRVGGLADGNLPTRLEAKSGCRPPERFIFVQSNFWHARQLWSPQSGGLIGGIGGSVIGCLAVSSAAWLEWESAPLCAGHDELLIGWNTLDPCGIAAVALKQPYRSGTPCVGRRDSDPGLFRESLSMKRRYEDLEIRRMTSMDATEGNDSSAQ